MDTDPVSFGQWLKRKRRAHDLTQEELAEQVGCALATLRKLESGERRPSKEIALHIAEVLAVPEAERANFVAFARAVFPEQAAPPVPVLDDSVPVPRAREDRATRTHNLPAQLTSFIGRDLEIASVSQLLENTRLLTLTGVGGSGKTRLALQVASRLVEGTSEAFRDGVWLVDLARLSDPSLVPHAITSALGLRDEAGRPLLEQLADYFRPKQLLLLLDNCEHLIDACATVAETLLRAAPKLQILATSREPLAIDGELTFQVPSLRVPDPLHLPPFEQTIAYEGIRLFAERAAGVRPGFEVTRGDADTVVEICHQLDGIPLAIELAASRTKVLPVAEIRTRLADRFQLLTTGSRTALPRHQTLRATIEWSYALLSEPERKLLRQLAVFAGGWTLDAAEAVCCPGGDATQPSILDLLEHLIDKSLVVADWRGRANRYGMLETLRQFALEQLEHSGEAPIARHRHAVYFIELAQQAEPKLMSMEQRAWQVRLEDEHNNIQVALDWLVSEEAAQELARPKEAALLLAGSLWRYWEVRGHLAEGRARLELLAEADDTYDPAVLARAHLGAGVCAFYGSDFPTAAVHYETSAKLYRLLGDDRAVTRPLTYLGWMNTYRGDFALARGQLEEALRISREAGDLQAETWATARLGILAFWGADAAKGVPLLERALEMSRAIGDDLGTGWWLLMLGQVVFTLGQLERSEELLEECLVCTERLGDRRDYSFALAALGFVALARGDMARSFSLTNASARIFKDLGYLFGMMEPCMVGALALMGVDPLTGIGWASCVFGICEAHGWMYPLPLLAYYEAIVAPVRQAFGEEAYEAAWQEGRSLTPDELMSGVLEASRVYGAAAPYESD